MTDDNDHVRTLEYTALNQVQRALSARPNNEGPAPETEYDKDGLAHVTRVDNPAFPQSAIAQVDALTVSRDERRRVGMATDAKGESVTLTYDDANHVTLRLDAAGYYTEMRYDILHRPVETRRYKNPGVTSGEAIVNTYTYDAAGHLVAENVGAPGSHVTEHVYDRQGRRIASIAHPGGVTGPIKTWLYDDRGLLAETVDEDANKTLFTYDAAGRLTQTDFRRTAANLPWKRIETQYDYAGQVTRVEENSLYSGGQYVPQAGDLRQDFVWNNLRQCPSQTWSLYDGTLSAFTAWKTLACGYDDKGLRISMDHPDGAILDCEYAYNEDDQLETFTGNPSAQPSSRFPFAFDYAKSGLEAQRTLANGTPLAAAYSVRGELLARRDADAAGGTSVDFGYGYDPRGLRDTAKSIRIMGLFFHPVSTYAFPFGAAV